MYHVPQKDTTRYQRPWLELESYIKIAYVTLRWLFCILFDCLPNVHNSECISPKNSSPFLFFSQPHHTTILSIKRLISRIAPEKLELVIAWKVPYHTILLSNLISVASIEATSSFTMIRPRTKT